MDGRPLRLLRLRLPPLTRAGGTRHPFCRTPGDRCFPTVRIFANFTRGDSGKIARFAATFRVRLSYLPPNLAKEFRQIMQFDDFPEMAKKFCPQCGTKITDHMGRPRSFCSERCRRNWWKVHPEFAKPHHPPCTPIAAVPADNRLPPMATATASTAAVLATCKTATTNRKELKSCKHQPYAGKPSHWLPNWV